MGTSIRQANALVQILLGICILAITLSVYLGVKNSQLKQTKKYPVPATKGPPETVVIEADTGPVTITSRDIVKIGDEEGRIVIFRDEGFKEEPCTLIVNLWFPNSNDPKIWTSTRFQSEMKGRPVTIYEYGTPRYNELLSACSKK